MSHQDPPAGTKVPRDTVVKIFIFDKFAESEVMVPDITSVHDAIQRYRKLKDAGLTQRPHHISVGNAPSKDKEFKVSHQDPPAGTRVRPDIVVKIFIFDKFVEPEVIVPNVMPLASEEAIYAALRGAGLEPTVAPAGNAPSKDQEFKVKSQSHAAGTKVKRGTPVVVLRYGNFVPDTIRVPNLAAFDSVSEMKAALAHAGLTGNFVVSKVKPPTREKAFKHQSQTPVPDELVARGSLVTVFIYPKFEGKDVTVPNLATYSDLDSMKATLKGMGLNWALAGVKPPTKEKEFKFAGQSPEAGTTVPEGETVTISMYQEFGAKDKDKVPNVIDDSLESAVAKLEAAGLRVGSIESGTKPPNPDKALRIYQQSPAAGEALPADKVVSLKQYGSAKEAAPPEQPPSADTGSATASGDFVGTWEGMLQMPMMQKPVHVVYVITRNAKGYLLGIPKEAKGGPPERVREEAGKLVHESDLDIGFAAGGLEAKGANLHFKTFFSIEGDVMKVDVQLSMQGKVYPTVPAGTLRRKG